MTTMPDWSAMTGAELLAHYNAMVVRWQAARGDNRFGSTNRFADHPRGQRRCAKLWRALEERTVTASKSYDYHGLRIEVREGVPLPAAVVDPRHPHEPVLHQTTSLDLAMKWVDEQAPAPAPEAACTYPDCKCIVSTSTTQPTPVCPLGLPAKQEESVIQLTPDAAPEQTAADQTQAAPEAQGVAESEDEMVKKRKTKRAAKGSSGAKRAPRANGSETLLQQRDRYNELAQKAIAKGLQFRIVGLGADKKRYPNGTTFASRAQGEAAIARVTKALRG